MLKTLKKNWATLLVLFLVFLFALFLRTVNLSKYPVGFQIDEAILGYTGYSILHTLKDTNGVIFPMYTEVFGDYIPTGYHYLTIPSILLFGLTEFSTRLPGAIIGALMIIPVYFLARAFFRNNTISLMSAFFISISPWNLILSRGSSEALVSVFFVLSGFALVIESLRTESSKKIIAGYILLAVSFFFYHTPRLFVPLMLSGLYIFLWKTLYGIKSTGYKKILTVGFFIIIVIITLLVLSFKGATARFDQISIFSAPEVKLVLEEQIREDGTIQISPNITRGFHNKLINTFFAFSQNYIDHLSIDTLFLKSGVPIMFSIPNTGLIYLAFLPFFIFGLGRLLFEKDKISKSIYVWILIAPVVAALTVDDIPNMRRSSVLFPVIEIVSVYGVYEFIMLFKKNMRKLVITIIAALFLWSFLYFLHQYFIHGYNHRPWYRNNGFAEMMRNVNENYEKYDKVVATKTGGGYPLVLFYSQYDPEKYISEGSPKDADYKGFGKYIFIPNDCPSINSSVRLPEGTKVLYVDRGTCEEPSKLSGKIYKNIYREDGSLGFRVVY
jgi:4-amino-4-deoxy-L-arabinose transferase-like glycosyltransferase